MLDNDCIAGVCYWKTLSDGSLVPRLDWQLAAAFITT